MSTLFMGGVLLALSALLALRLQKRIEEVFAVSIFCIIAVLYIAGLFGNLKIGFYLILFLSVAAGVYSVYLIGTKQCNAFDFLITPGLLVFLLFLGIVWYGHRGRLFSVWDEFSHWGLVIKNMVYLDQLGNAVQATTYFRGYPPATSLFAYFWIKLAGVYNESDAFRSANVFLFSLLLPMFKRLEWRNWLRLPVVFLVALLLPCQFAAGAYTSIYVDTLLGILFAFALFQYFTNEKNDSEILLFSSALFILPLVKASGTGLALIAVIIIAVDVLLVERGWKLKRKAMWIAAPALAVLVGKFSWNIYLRLTDTSEAWNTSGLTASALWNVLIGNGEAYQANVISNYFEGIFSPSQYTFGYIIKLSVFMWALVFVFFSVALIFSHKGGLWKKRYTVCLTGTVVGLGVYTISLLLLYLFTFSPYEAEGLASFSRYISTYLTGMFALLVALYIDRFAAEKGKQGGVCYLILAIMMISVNAANLLPITFETASSVENTRKIREAREVPQSVLDSLDVNKDRVYIICQNDNGFRYWINYYNFTPIHTGAVAWSLGEPYDDGDIWTQNLTVEEFSAELEEYTHVYVYRADEQFINKYGILFEDPSQIANRTLFRIEKQSKKLVLVSQ